MNLPPAFQFYPKDFMSDARVQSMSDEQVGKYIRLLSICWTEDGLDPGLEVIKKLFKGGSTNDQPDALIMSCFYEKDGKLRSRRLDNEREKQIDWREKSSRGGKKSAESKRVKKSIKGGATTVQPTRLKGGGTLLSSSSSSSSIIKEIICYLNDKAGKNFSPSTKSTRKIIVGKVGEGVTVEQFKRVIDTKVLKWKGDPKMDEY